MNREQIEELAALDALGALDGDDLTAWRALVQNDAAASRLRDELAEAAAGLAMLAPEAKAPEALRCRVMGAVFGTDTAESPSTTEAGQNGAWPAWAAAAAIAALALVGTAATTSQRESVIVRDARPDAGAPYVALTGYGEFADSTASVLWDSGQRGWWLQASGLPALPPTHRYRVWAIGEGDGQIYDCGELTVRPGGLARRFLQPPLEVESMQGFAVSIEPVGRQGGKPSNPAILITPALRG